MKLNDDIPKYPRILLLGEPPEITSVEAALELAQARGLDLVELDPNSSPPVCKLMDFEHWLQATRFNGGLRNRETFVALSDDPDPERRLSVPALERPIATLVHRLQELGPDAPAGELRAAFVSGVLEATRDSGLVARYRHELVVHLAAIGRATGIADTDLLEILADAGLRDAG